MKMRSLCWIACAVAVLAFACGKGQSADDAAKPKLDSQARKTELAALEKTKKELDAKREELASLKDQLKGGAAVATEIDTTSADINKMADDLGQRLVAYINANPPVEGTPFTPNQKAAIRIKSGEDLLTATEYINLAGDYRKAIDIYQAALAIDPDNADLQAALSDAQAKRFMTADRFAAVKKGMTEDQVINALGRPLTRNMRDYPQKHVSAWFYPKNDGGEAAGVFFNSKKQVYSTDFNAVKRETVTEQ